MAPNWEGGRPGTTQFKPSASWHFEAFTLQAVADVLQRLVLELLVGEQERPSSPGLH